MFKTGKERISWLEIPIWPDQTIEDVENYLVSYLRVSKKAADVSSLFVQGTKPSKLVQSAAPKKQEKSFLSLSQQKTPS